MPKIYNTPGSKGEQPEQAAKSRNMMIAVAIIVALLVIFLLYRMARGMDYAGPTTPQMPTAASLTVANAHMHG